MDRRAVDQYYHFLYDPAVYGVSLDYWAELSGAALATSNIVRFSQDILASKEQYAFGDFVFRLTIPAAPTAGDTRRWGLISPAFGTGKNAIYFDISGTAFTANVVNDDGTNTQTTITWDSDWTAAATDFRIHWDRKEARFYINDVTYAVEDDFDLLPLLITLPVYLRNDNADNMDLTYMQLRNLYQVVAPRWAVGEPGPDTTQDRQINTSQSVTVSESITMANTTLGGISVNDAITVTEAVTMSGEEFVDLNDSITVSEAVTMANTNLGGADVNDAITVSEAVTMDNSSLGGNTLTETVLVADVVTMANTNLGGIAITDAPTETVTVVEAITIEVV